MCDGAFATLRQIGEPLVEVGAAEFTWDEADRTLGLVPTNPQRWLCHFTLPSGRMGQRANYSCGLALAGNERSTLTKETTAGCENNCDSTFSHACET